MSTHDETAALRELAGRLLAAGQGGSRGEGHTVQLLPGVLPPDLPFAVPLPPGSRVIGSAVQQIADPFAGLAPWPDRRRQTWQVVFDTPAPVAEVAALYEQTLTGQGWTMEREGPRMRPEGGFAADFEALRRTHPPPPEVQARMAAVERRHPEHRTFCPPPGTAGALRLIVAPGQSGPTQVHLHFDDHEWGPCGMQEMFEGGVTGRLPRLTAPDGVDLMPGGGGGGTDHYTSQATATTDQPVAALEAHFAAQLTAAGWVRRAGQAEELLAWSAWTVPGEPPAGGFLSVRVAEGTDRRECTVLIEAADHEGGAFGTSFVVGKSAMMKGQNPGRRPTRRGRTTGDDRNQ